MSPLCLARLHNPSPSAVWNAGYYVTHCSRCGADLIRRPQAPWRQVPKGYRIVWSPKPGDYPDWEAFTRTAAEAAAPKPQPAAGEKEPHIRLVVSAADPADSAGRLPSFREWRSTSRVGTG